VAWDKLMKNTMLRGIPDNDIHYYSLSIDVPTITQPDRQRFYVCINTSNAINNTKASEQQTKSKVESMQSLQFMDRTNYYQKLILTFIDFGFRIATISYEIASGLKNISIIQITQRRKI
jgi:hypothetical protein